jgi:hypothetical protein
MGIAFGVMLILYAALRFGVGAAYFIKFSEIPIAQLSLQDRLVNIPAVIFYYIKTFFFPAELAFNQQWIIRQIDVGNFYFPFIGILLLLIILFAIGLYFFAQIKSDSKTYFFFLIWFITGLLFISQLLPLNMTVADRWFYFPIIGLLGIIGYLLNGFSLKNIKISPFVLIFLSLVIVIIFSYRTIVRNTDWKDNLTLYSHDTKIYTNASIENDLGMEYGKLSQYDNAITHLNNAVEMRPCEWHLYNLGYAYELNGQKQLALTNYKKAIHAKPCKRTNTNHLEILYLRLGRLLILINTPIEAKQIVKDGLDEYPQSVTLWALLGLSEYYTQNHEGAINAASQAGKLLPNQATYSLYMDIVNKQEIPVEKYLNF